jgi:hypothetical protein
MVTIQSSTLSIRSPKVHGTFVPKNITVTSLHSTELQNKITSHQSPTKHNTPINNAYNLALSTAELAKAAFECFAMPYAARLTITFTAVGDVNHPLPQPLPSVEAITPSITASVVLGYICLCC